MAWIELHQALPTHRKTLAVSESLGIPRVYVVGHLSALWLWALDNAPTGTLKRVTAGMIAKVAEWPGDPMQFADALTDAGFLEFDGQDYRIHDWMDFAGKLVDEREKERERSRQRREAERQRRELEHLNSNGASGGRPEADRPTTDGTVPNPTVPNPTQPEETTFPLAVAVGAPAAAQKSTRPPPIVLEPTPKPKPVSRELWDALSDAIPGGAPATESGRGAWNGAIRQLHSANVKPADVPGLVAAYQDRWPEMDCTPNALAKHLQVIRAPPRPLPSARGSPHDKNQRGALGKNTDDFYEVFPGLKGGQP